MPSEERCVFVFSQALKKAVYKPGAFYKGLLLPLCASGTCTVREAVIWSSLLARISIPVLHSSVAILKIAEMPYSGTNRCGEREMQELRCRRVVCRAQAWQGAGVFAMHPGDACMRTQWQVRALFSATKPVLPLGSGQFRCICVDRGFVEQTQQTIVLHKICSRDVMFRCFQGVSSGFEAVARMSGLP